MTRPAAAQRVEHLGLREVRGPLLVLDGVTGVGWDEFARIRLESGEIRHGLVLAVDRDVVVVEVLEGTDDLHSDGTRVTFDGAPLKVPVGESWLGRTCNGRGEPIDGGPPLLSRRLVPVSGSPINPVHREPPAEPILTGISVMDALTTLVRGQKLRGLLLGRSAAPRPRRADRRPGLGRRGAVQRRLRGHGAHPPRCRRGA